MDIVDFEHSEIMDLLLKILRHEGYLIELKDNEYKLTDKGKIVVREIEHV